MQVNKQTRFIPFALSAPEMPNYKEIAAYQEQVEVRDTCRDTIRHIRSEVDSLQERSDVQSILGNGGRMNVSHRMSLPATGPKSTLSKLGNFLKASTWAVTPLACNDAGSQ